MCQCNCGCHDDDESCAGGACGMHNNGESCEHCDKAEYFLDLAKEAHHELLKDKMKAAFEAKLGKKMDRIAEAVVNAALVHMQGKMAEDKALSDYRRQLFEIFKA